MTRGSLFGTMSVTVLAVALAVAAPLEAVPGGQIGTLPTGRYLCETPGDLAREVRLRVPEADFDIITGSNYIAPHLGRGSYLLTGDRLVFTSGPFNGRKFQRVYSGFLRMENKREDGTELRCVLATRY